MNEVQKSELEYLIESITGISSNPSTIRTNWKTLTSIHSIGSLANLDDVAIIIKNLAHRSRIEMKDELSEALLFSFKNLTTISNQDKEGLLRPSRLPDVLQFLILLAGPPSSQNYAHEILWERDHPESPPEPLTWKQIYEEEGLEQEVAIQYSDSDSEDDDSSSSTSIDFPITPKKTRPSIPIRPPISRLSPHLIPDEAGLVHLESRQYWKSLGSEHSNEILGLNTSQACWDEVDVVREVLGALQGHTGAELFEQGIDGVFRISTTAPALSHLSLSTFHSLLSSFLPSINALNTLRFFNHKISNRLETSRNSPTIEAFVSALESTLQVYQYSCVNQEINILSPKSNIVISLLQLSNQVQIKFRALETLVLTIANFESLSFTGTQEFSSQEKSAALLDFLVERIERAYEEREIEAAEDLRRIFELTFEPIWKQLGNFLTKGRLEEVDNRKDGAFFIKRLEGLEEIEGDFFRIGFQLSSKEGGDRSSVPMVLHSIVEELLDCGKSASLLRSVAPEKDSLGSVEWPTFSTLLGSNLVDKKDSNGNESSLNKNEVVSKAFFATYVNPQSFPTSELKLASLGSPFSQFVQEKILDQCEPLFLVSNFKLHRVFMEDARLRYHLNAIQGIFLMRQGFEVGTFLSAIFEKMDSGVGSVWSDFQLLNSSWSKAISGTSWTDASLIRFRLKPSRGGNKSRRTSARSVQVFDQLQIDYSLPPPLTYFFSPESMRIYTQVFTFLIKIRRAKHLLDRISLIKLVESIIPALQHSEFEIRRYYGLRQKLTWVLAILFDFFIEFVVGKEIENFEGIVDKSTTLEELVGGHEIHVLRLRDRLLLNPATQSIHRAIVSILDLCVDLSDLWTTINSDSTLPGESKRRKNRRRKQQVDSDSDSSAVESDEAGREEGEGTTYFGVTLQELGFSDRIEKLEEELEDLVGFVKRGIDGLNDANSKEVRDLFSILSSKLDVWH